MSLNFCIILHSRLRRFFEFKFNMLHVIQFFYTSIKIFCTLAENWSSKNVLFRDAWNKKNYLNFDFKTFSVVCMKYCKLYYNILHAVILLFHILVQNTIYLKIICIDLLSKVVKKSRFGPPYMIPFIIFFKYLCRFELPKKDYTVLC